MNKTKIEWVKNEDGSEGYTWNPIVGCKTDCSYCYAKTLNDRFKFIEDWTNPETVEAKKSIKQLKGFREPKTIFVGSMSDLFGYWVSADYIKGILSHCMEFNYKHTFLFLTKNPGRYLDSKINPFMDWEFAFPNMWRGTTVTNRGDFSRIDTIRSFGRNFVSCEPVLGDMRDINLNGIAWLIIGTLNKDGRPVPEDQGGTSLKDVLVIVEAAVEAAYLKGIQIFIKAEVFEAFPEIKADWNLPEFRRLPYLPEEVPVASDPGGDNDGPVKDDPTDEGPLPKAKTAANRSQGVGRKSGLGDKQSAGATSGLQD